MGVYKVSGKAETDLIRIYEYGIETLGLQQARYYLLGIHDLFQILTDNVHLGWDTPEFAPSLKRFSYQSHTIFYLAAGNSILIIRVLSQSVDYEQH